VSGNYALYEGAFGTAIVLELQANLVPHAHSETQIAFWLGGSPVEARIGNEIVRYGEDTALGSNAYEMHDATLLDESRPAFFLCFMISKAWLDNRRRVSGRPLILPSPRVPVDAALREACWRVLDLLVSGHESRTAVDDEVQRLLVAAISASTSPATVTGHRVIASCLDRRLRAAISYMRNHLSEKCTIDEVANNAGLSRAHLFALFRDQLNTTPLVFWSAVKVEEAMVRLVTNRDSLTHVAMEVGFSAPGNFSRFFKEHTGVSPSTFRRAAKEPETGPITGLPRTATNQPSQQQGVNHL